MVNVYYQSFSKLIRNAVFCNYLFIFCFHFVLLVVVFLFLCVFLWYIFFCVDVAIERFFFIRFNFLANSRCFCAALHIDSFFVVEVLKYCLKPRHKLASYTTMQNSRKNEESCIVRFTFGHIMWKLNRMEYN